MRLTNVDYINILKYYNLYKKNMKKNEIKNIAENILADKLCRCIKKTNVNNEPNESKYIAICLDSVINKKNLKIYGFKCNNGYKLKPKKNGNTLLVKRGKLFNTKKNKKLSLTNKSSKKTRNKTQKRRKRQK